MLEAYFSDDNTSGRRQQIIFYAGTSYSRGNYINVIANNWFGTTTPTITNLKLETGGTAKELIYIFIEFLLLLTAFMCVYMKMLELQVLEVNGINSHLIVD